MRDPDANEMLCMLFAAALDRKPAPKEDDDPIIISPSPMVTFTCQHCGTKFKTRKWTRTKGGHYGAFCPCCPYQAWAE